jgi:hypothetical protein
MGQGAPVRAPLGPDSIVKTDSTIEQTFSTDRDWSGCRCGPPVAWVRRGAAPFLARIAGYARTADERRRPSFETGAPRPGVFALKGPSRHPRFAACEPCLTRRVPLPTLTVLLYLVYF